MNRAWTGLVRTVVVLALGSALVAAAQADPRLVDLRRYDPTHGSDQAGPAVGRSAPLTAARTCAGPELVGLKGVPDQAQNVTVTAGRAPGSALAAEANSSGTNNSGTNNSGSTGSGPTGGGHLELSIPSATGAAGAPLARASALTVTTQLSTPTSVLASATGALAPGLAANQTWSADTKDLRGLVLVPCPADSEDLWLIAGGGDAGRQERLVLANPGANEVSVDVTVLGAKGVVLAPNGRGLIVPGRGRTAVLLDAIAAGEPSPVVHVVVRGGTVSAVLSDVWLDGSIAAGADATAPTAAPTTRQIIPAVELTQRGLVRIGVPGDTQAVTSVRVLTANGGAPLPGGGVRTIPGGSTVDLPLADLPTGTYAVEVTSDVPVVAAAFGQARDGSAPGDFAWTPATKPLTGVAGAPLPALPDGGHRQLVLAASAGPVQVTVLTGDPAKPSAQTISLGADRIQTVDLSAADTGVWLSARSGQGQLRAAVVQSQGTGATRLMATLPLTDTVTKVSAPRAYPLP